MTDPARTPAIEDLLAHGDLLRALARRLVADEATANDVVQDVWLRALRRPPRNHGSLAGWFARVTRNLARDRARSEAARGLRERSVAGGQAEDPGPVAARAETFEQLGRAFAGLPPTYRDALFLRFYEDRGPREVAEALGVSLATAKTRLRRGLELLRNDLEGRLGRNGNFALLLLPLATAPSRTAALKAAASSGGIWMTKKVIAAGLMLLVGGGLWLTRERTEAGQRFARNEPTPSQLQPAQAVAAPVGSVAAEDRQDPAQLQPASLAREAVADPAAAAGFAGRVVYAATGQGVPFYGFVLSDAAGEQRLVTSETGAFTSPIHHGDPGARVELTLPGARPPAPAPSAEEMELLDPASAVPVSTIDFISAGPLPVVREAGVDVRELVPGDGPHEIAITLGPTYLLDFDLPAGYAHDDFDATIVGVKHESLRERRNLQPVQAEPRPWVRFAEPDDYCIDEPWDWRFELLSHDGVWAGRAATDWVRGVHEQTVEVQLVPHTQLTGIVRDEQGRALAGLGVQLQEQGGERTHYRRTDDTGRYVFELLEPAAYAQFVHEDHYLPWKETVALPGGETIHDITLTARQSGGPIRGRVTSATGTFGARVFLFLEGQGDQNVWRRHDVEWADENGMLVGEFDFDDLGHGTYRLVCNTIEGVAIAERVRSVSPPSTDIHFHIQDDRPVAPLDIRVVDADTGVPIEDFHFLSRVEHGYMDDHRVTPKQPLQRRFREGVFFEWWIRVDGYRPAGGTAREVAADGALTVRLQPGFGAVVHVLSIASLSSLSGVTVYADGEPVGVTDAGGDLVLDLPQRPLSLGFDPEQWTIYSDGGCHSDIDPHTGAYDPGDDFHIAAYLRRME